MLGYDLYSSSMADILSEPSLSMPISVGLYAKWGSGKSFLIRKLKGMYKTVTIMIVYLLCLLFIRRDLLLCLFSLSDYEVELVTKYTASFSRGDVQFRPPVGRTPIPVLSSGGAGSGASRSPGGSHCRCSHLLVGDRFGRRRSRVPCHYSLPCGCLAWLEKVSDCGCLYTFDYTYRYMLCVNVDFVGMHDVILYFRQQI